MISLEVSFKCGSNGIIFVKCDLYVSTKYMVKVFFNLVLA
jgi:hypothetical protein